MTASRTKRIIVALLSCTLTAMAQIVPAPTLRLLHGSEAGQLLRHVDLRQLPPGVHLDADLQQEFILASPHSESLGLVATYFNYEPVLPDRGPSSQCGLFLLRHGSRSQYISTIGPGFQHGSTLCSGVRALGLIDPQAPYPRLISIFSGTGMHGEEYPVPFVLVWNTQQANYQLDSGTSQWLQQGKQFAGSVAAVRRLLIRRPAP